MVRRLPLSPSIPESPIFLSVDHERVRHVDADIFALSFVSDCAGHACLCREDGDRLRIDACCQHGADVTVPEKLAILGRAREIASVLKPERKGSEGWFDERDPEPDPEAPLGYVVRTATSDLEDESSGCVFLAHQGARGCGLHLAAVEHGFDPAEVKPSVCRLYPLMFSEGRLGLSPDFHRYSCANAGSTSVYEVMRSTIDQMLGSDALRALDRLAQSAQVSGAGAVPAWSSSVRVRRKQRRSLT